LKRTKLGLLALLLGLALSACGSTNTGGLPPNWNDILNGNGGGNGGGGNQSGNEIAITVGSQGGVPTYSWSGGGGQSLTIVRTSNPGVPVWVIATPGRDGVTSPVTQGTIPAGAVEAVAAERTLTPGVEYRVTVARIATNNAGWEEFTP
jgi:hypothetical protein